VRKKKRPESCHTLQVHAPKPVKKHENLNPCQEAISRHNRKKVSSIIHHGTFFPPCALFLGAGRGGAHGFLLIFYLYLLPFVLKKKKKNKIVRRKKEKVGPGVTWLDPVLAARARASMALVVCLSFQLC